MRRTQWLQRSQAIQVVNAYAEAMNPKRTARGTGESQDDHPPQRNAPTQGRKVSGDEMLRKVTGGF